MKSAAMNWSLDPAVAGDVDAGIRRLVANLRVTLARTAEDPQVADTERLVREAQALRAAFLQGPAKRR